MKIDQLAYYAHSTEQVQQIKEQFGLSSADWVEDVVRGEAQVFKLFRTPSEASLMFNYDLGIELEILTYLEGPHWHMSRPEFRSGEIFLSHVGIHMAAGEVSNLPESQLCQKMWTSSHTNSYLVERKRTYYYEIYKGFGPDLKFIWRIENGKRS